MKITLQEIVGRVGEIVAGSNIYVTATSKYYACGGPTCRHDPPEVIWDAYFLRMYKDYNWDLAGSKAFDEEYPNITARLRHAEVTVQHQP